MIAWTKENGSHHDDPSVLAFVADADGKVIAKAENVSQPSAFAKWLEEQAADYERTHPTTRIPFVRAQVVAEGAGADRTVSCADLESAHAAGRAVLLYVGRSERPGDAKSERALAAASRSFEKKTLGSKSAAEVSSRALLLRLDIGDPDHAQLATSLGVKKVPTLLLWEPGATEPADLGGRISGAALTAKLKQLPQPEEPEQPEEPDAPEEYVDE